jgi:hypothetical protein
MLLIDRALFPIFLGLLLTEERVERRLAAVLAADVARYSRLMGSNEVMRNITACSLAFYL